MALATKCPHCNTIFRVAADQLKIRGGIVRCGSCKEVFDGHAALLDSAAQQPPAQSVHSCPPLSPEPEAVSTQIAPLMQEPVAGPDLEDAGDQFEIRPGPVQAEPGGDADFPFLSPVEPEQNGAGVPELEAATQSWPMPEPQPEPWAEEPANEAEPGLKEDGAPESAQQQREPASELSADEPEEIVAVALSDYDMVEAAVAADIATIHEAQRAEPEPATGDQQADDLQAEAPEAEPPAIASARQGSAAATDPVDEPGFVRQGRRRARTARTVRVMMGFGSLLLFIALLVQGVTTFRNELAAQLPQFKPTLVSICNALGCRIELPAQIELVTIEQGELQVVAENMFSYLSVLHNKSTSAQAWPHIELILNDANDKPVLRRVLTPREYLPTPAELSEGFPPRSEQAVKLYFELAQLKASGYHIAVFYP